MPVLPDELALITERVTALRRAKEDAVDAQDFMRAAEIRDAEKAIVRDGVAELDEQTARAHLTIALDMIPPLQARVDSLLALLHHNTEPPSNVPLPPAKPQTKAARPSANGTSCASGSRT